MDKVKEVWLKIYTPVKTKFSSLDKKVKICIIAIIGVLIVSAVILGIIMSQTGYSVLISGASTAETNEIVAYARDTLGATDIRVNANGDILVPDDQVEGLRVELSIAGYPKSTFNYNTYNNSIDLFSTESQIREVSKQQLQDNLMATINSIDGVDSSIVMIAIPENASYVIVENQDPVTASVTLQLRRDLTSEEIDGLYNLVANSVPGLDRENINISDSTGKTLIATIETDEGQLEQDRLNIYYQRLEYQEKFRQTLEEGLEEMFAGVYDLYNVKVGLLLNFDSEVSQSTIYTGSNVDEDGHQTGIVDSETIKNAAGGTAADGGLVGTTVDSDISPDYPTLTVGEDGEFYYESSKEIHYMVNEEKKQIEKDGYSIESLTASVMVNRSTPLTTDESDQLRRIIAASIGASIDNVSVMAVPFVMNSGSTLDGDSVTLNAASSNNMILLAVIIVLGVILIVLLILALTASGSKKKRASGARRLATATAGAGGYTPSHEPGDDLEQSGSSGISRMQPPEEDFDLPSLSDAVPETRDEALKREIREFSKDNPEIVAQLIRSWMRNDEL